MNVIYNYFHYNLNITYIYIWVAIWFWFFLLYLWTYEKKNESKLIKAVKKNDFELVKDIIYKGCDINSVDTKWRPATYYANKEILIYLIKKWADLEINNYNNWTLLMKGCSNYNYDIVELLLKNWAKPNIKEEDGNTALLCMLEIYNWIWWKKRWEKVSKIIKLLIKYWADINIIDENGETALDNAYNKNHIKILEDAWAKSWS